MKNYFVNKYGAIKDIDFSPIFEDLVKGKDKIKDNEDEIKN